MKARRRIALVAPVVLTVASASLVACGGSHEEIHGNPPADPEIIANPPGPEPTAALPDASAEPAATDVAPQNPPRNPPMPQK
jgi:hypothetical protein